MVSNVVFLRYGKGIAGLEFGARCCMVMRFANSLWPKTGARCEVDDDFFRATNLQGVVFSDAVAVRRADVEHNGEFDSPHFRQWLAPNTSIPLSDLALHVEGIWRLCFGKMGSMTLIQRAIQPKGEIQRVRSFSLQTDEESFVGVAAKDLL